VRERESVCVCEREREREREREIWGDDKIMIYFQYDFFFNFEPLIVLE